MLRLAKDLGQTLDTVMQMTTHEFKLWVAFYNLEAEENKRAQEKAKRSR